MGKVEDRGTGREEKAEEGEGEERSKEGVGWRQVTRNVLSLHPRNIMFFLRN